MKAIAAFLALFTFLCAPLAKANVTVSFYSVPGSMITGRSVHAFFTFSGTITSNGKAIDENYGFSAASWNPAGFFRPVKQTMLIEKPDYIQRARFHFSTNISDQTYNAIVQEVNLWWHSPDYLWDIDKRNCVTFVGVVAQMAGLKVEFPPKMMRQPRRYLDHIATLNPHLSKASD